MVESQALIALTAERLFAAAGQLIAEGQGEIVLGAAGLALLAVLALGAALRADLGGRRRPASAALPSPSVRFAEAPGALIYGAPPAATAKGGSGTSIFKIRPKPELGRNSKVRRKPLSRRYRPTNVVLARPLGRPLPIRTPAARGLSLFVERRTRGASTRTF